MSVYTINLKPVVDRISEQNFEHLCVSNPELKLETDAEGNLIVMSPTGSITSERNSSLLAQVWNWNNLYKLGKVFDSSGGFKLSNGAVRSPDVSWIEITRWNSLTDKQKRGFAPIDPDFVIELMSPTDDLLVTQQKMTEYMNCDIKLGWLINPDEKQVEIYRQGQNQEILNNPSSLSGETVLPDLVVDLFDIF